MQIATCDLDAGMDEFHYLEVIEDICELIWKYAPERLQFPSDSAESATLASMLGELISEHAERVSCRPEDPRRPIERLKRFDRTSVLSPLLQLAGLTHESWAEQACVSATSVREYMAGRSNLRANTQEKLISTLRSRLSELAISKLP